MSNLRPPVPNEFGALGAKGVMLTTVVHVAPRRVAQPLDVLVIVAVAVHAEQVICFVEGDFAQEALTVLAVAIQTEHHCAEFEIGSTPRNSVVHKRLFRNVDVSVLLDRKSTRLNSSHRL